MTKRTWVTVLITALVTSFCWHVGSGVRSAIDNMWLISCVKVPGRKALDAIAEEMKNHRYAEANRRIEVLARMASVRPRGRVSRKRHRKHHGRVLRVEH